MRYTPVHQATGVHIDTRDMSPIAAHNAAIGLIVLHASFYTQPLLDIHNVALLGYSPMSTIRHRVNPTHTLLFMRHSNSRTYFHVEKYFIDSQIISAYIMDAVYLKVLGDTSLFPNHPSDQRHNATVQDNNVTPIA